LTRPPGSGRFAGRTVESAERHLIEEIGTDSAMRKADFADQVDRLKKWAGKEPGHKATVEVETTDRWTSIFSEFKHTLYDLRAVP
jgi:hypothetical protein